MGDISELELCCQQLATNKVSERKKQIEILQELLGSSHLTQQLDMNSSSSAESRVFTWDCVFRSVAGLVVKEAELMEQAENKGGKLPTSTSLNLRERKKRDCMRLLKSVIRLANKRALHLSTSALMWHIVDMLENDFTHQIFGTDYGSVLMKEVLPNRKLCCDVTSKIWNRLLHVYVLELQGCEDGKRRVDRVSVTSLLYTIIGKATEHCSVHQEIIPGLSHPLKNLRQEQNQVVVEHLVCTANILCRALAADCRHMICKMGEAVFNNMLHYFTVQTTPFLKGELVEFFHIQMAAHHPCGTKSGEPGAHAHNADTWGSHLRRLYESLDNELYKYTQPSSDIGKLDERLVHLCAGVWRHVLTAFPSTIDVTQCEPSSTLMASGRHKKRRRVETGWDSMRERLASLGASERAVPWLRLLHAILARHPADLPAAELPPLLDALQQALTACKGPSVSSWLFQCLAAVAGAQVSLRLQLSAKQEATLALAWRQVWFVTLRSVAAIHRGEGLDLLSTLMRHALVTPDHKLFQVFLATSYPVTRASLDTLATFIARHHIPERYVCDNMAAATSPEQLAGVRHPLRAQLVAWLLPGGDADEPAGRAHDAATRELLADALVALCLREPAAARRPHADPAPTPGDLDELQEVYLRTTFTRIRRASDDAGGGARACSDGVVVGEVKKKLERSLRKSAMLLIEAPTQGYQQAESMLSLCCVNVMVVRGLLMNGALQAGDLSQLELLNYGKELMRIAGCALMSTDRAASLQQSQQLQLLSILRQMYACSESGGKGAGSVAQLCRSLMPAELLQWLLKQATKIVKQGRAAGAPVATATGRKRSDFDELMELEFNDQAAAGPSQDLSFFFDEDDSMSQSSVMSAVQCSPLSQEGLSEQVMLELDCVRLLARYCACDGGWRRSQLTAAAVRQGCQLPATAPRDGE